MSDRWTVAAVQMDAKLGDVSANLSAVVRLLHTAAERGAKLVVFPECVLTGYGVRDRTHAVSLAQTLPGPATETLAVECRKLGVFALVGLFERDGDKLYNSCALVGPSGYLASYRKVHLPCVGADRFTDPGDRPFAVHDLGGLKLGIGICFDAGFPETCRVLALLGADAIALPTNWADKAIKNATLVSRVRALENHVYFLAVNRIGDETGFHYIGHSSIIDFNGDYLCYAEHDREEILLAEIQPTAARQKKIVHCLDEYEIDRVNWRRPEMYGPLAEPAPPFRGHARPNI